MKMNNTRFFVAIASVLLLAAGCAMNDVDSDSTSALRRGASPVFTSSFEKAETRTYVDSDLYMYWTADDRLSIFTSSYNEEYRFEGQTGATGGSFSKVNTDQFVSGNPISTNYGVYPYNASTSLTKDEKILLELPATQTYAENTFGVGANTMVAVTNGTSDTFLPFKNVCGYLVVNLYGEGKVTKVIFEGNNGEKIAGTATVVASHNTDPVMMMSDDATTSITIECGNGVELGKTAETATEFWFVIPPTTFSDGFTIKAVGEGSLLMTKSTSAARTIQRNVVNEMSAIEFVIDETPVVSPEAVDLGLPSGLKWASFNLGAAKPEDFGCYYAWGETSEKADYNWSSYKWCNGYYNSLTKYCTVTSYGYNGFTDYKTVLDADDDAARVNLGRDWRMPTDAEWKELTTQCSWTWITLNGNNGSLVTGPNGNSIFLPAAGWISSGGSNGSGSRGHYWLSSLISDDSYGAYFGYSDSYPSSMSVSKINRCCGLSIRPVYDSIIHIPDFIHITEVSFNLTDLTFTILGKSQRLIASFLPSDATNKNLTWTSSNSSVATVSQEGIVTSVGYGAATIFATSVDGGLTATCNVRVMTLPDGPIDLGLSVKWASCNLGATKPEGYGNYYGWGEVEIKSTYNWSTYKWCNGDVNTLTKYCDTSLYGYNGFTDNKTVLDAEDDAARVNLGGNWRMPTDAEWTELITQCTWTWTALNGIVGRLVQSPNGNSIFLPAAGYKRISSSDNYGGSYGYYWSSSLYTGYPLTVRLVYFNSGGVGNAISFRQRDEGLPVRSVCD